MNKWFMPDKINFLSDEPIGACVTDPAFSG
jgi:hypothetical protein